MMQVNVNDPIAEEPSVMEEEPVIELKKQEPAVSPIDSLFSSEFFSKENVSNGLPFIFFLLSPPRLLNLQRFGKRFGSKE